MKMNYNKIVNSLKNIYEGVIFESEVVDGFLMLSSNFSVEGYFDDYIYFLARISKENKVVDITFTFDMINEDLDVYKLINTLNINTKFKAYLIDINDKTYLELNVFNDELKSTKNVVNHISYYLNELSSEDLEQFLKPLTNKTVESED